MSFLLILLSIIPTVIIGFYIYNKDNVKEPKKLLLGLFLSGFFALILTLGVNLLILAFFPEIYLSDDGSKYNHIQLFFLIFAQVALVEEFFKWLMLRLFGYSNKAFDQIYDIIVYAVFVSLGFATIENIFYVLEGGVDIALYRGIFSIPGHVAFGIFMGYCLAFAKLNEKINSFKYNIYMGLSLLLPVLFHTLYDYFLMIEEPSYFLIFIGFVIILFVNAFREVSKISKNNIKVE